MRKFRLKFLELQCICGRHERWQLENGKKKKTVPKIRKEKEIPVCFLDKFSISTLIKLLKKSSSPARGEANINPKKKKDKKTIDKISPGEREKGNHVECKASEVWGLKGVVCKNLGKILVKK